MKNVYFIILVFTACFFSFSSKTFAQTTTFLETFDTPTTNGPPLPFTQLNQTRWDVAVQNRDGYPVFGDRSKLVPMKAHHPADCSAPATYDTGGNLTGLRTRDIGSDVSEHVFKCNNHLMTSFAANGYGAMYLTPNHMIDFTNGEAVIRFDMTTFRSSKRDWIDVWITPMEDEVQLPLNPGFPDLQDAPRRAIQINLELESFFCPNVYINHESVVDTAPWTNTSCKQFTTLQSILADHDLALDPKRRDIFEIRIRKDHIKVWMPAYDNPPGSAVFFDADLRYNDAAGPRFSLDWTKGIVQFGHHWYSPDKMPLSDYTHDTRPGYGDYVNTWHWDNISLSPSVPFTIIKPTNTRYVEGSAPTTHTVNFASPAPANSHLRFSAWGDNTQISFNGGTTWQTAPRVEQGRNDTSHIFNYRVDNIPTGTQSIRLRGNSQAGAGGLPFIAKDFSIFSTTVGPTPTPDPNATPTPTPTNAPTPTNIVPSVSPTIPQSGSVWLGNQTVGTTPDSSNSNAINGSVFTSSSQGGMLESASVHVRTIDPNTANRSFEIGVYSDNNGAPGTLLAKSDRGTLFANTWSDVTFSGTNKIMMQPNTKYWLMYNTNGSTGGVNNLSVSPGNDNQSAWILQTFGSWPLTITTPNFQSVVFSIFVTYTSGTTPPRKPGNCDGLTNPLDNDVDIFDYNIAVGSFGSTTDLRCDFALPLGQITIFDYNVVIGNFGT